MDKIYAFNHGNTLLPYSSFTLFNGNNVMDSHYKLYTGNDIYDDYGDLLQSSSLGKPTSILWGYNRQFPVAEVDNALQQDIAYTSFENNDFGNWNVPNVTGIVSSDLMGTKAYNLSEAGSTGITRTGLDPSKTYIVSYYNPYQNLSYNVTGSQGTPNQFDLPSWHYYEHRVTGVSTVKITGIGTIDELRLYPADAQMTTYAYDPLLGMTVRCDQGGRITHYGYDKAIRLDKIWDEYINLIKMYQYKYQATIND